MPTLPLDPFENEADALDLGDLHIENRIDRVSLYGTLDITRDKPGLAIALELQSLLNAVVDKLKGEELPDRVAIEHPEPGENPFL